MRPWSLAVLIVPTLLLAAPVAAQDVLQWGSGSNPFDVGDEGGHQVSSEGLTVGWVAESSFTSGRMRVVAEFCNSSGFDWEGGMRLTHIPPERGHLTLRVPARDCINREEIIPTGVEDIYILLDEY